MKLEMVRRGCGVAAALLLCAGSLPAQSCLGRGVGGVAARAVLAEAAHAEYRSAGGTGKDIGAVYWANPDGWLGYSVSYARRLLEGPDAHTGRGELAIELGAPRGLPPGGGACLTAGIEASVYDIPEHRESWRIVSFPIGAAVGLVLPVTSRTRIYPFVHPRIVFTTTTRDHDPGGTVDFPRLLSPDPFVRAAAEVGAGFARGPIVARIRVGGTTPSAGEARPPIADLRAGLEVGIRF